MTHKPNQKTHTSLEEAESQFEQWREQRIWGTQIPVELWDLATAVAREHGVSKASRTLKLGYYKLKDRALAPETTPAAPGAKTRSEKAETKARFRELFFPSCPTPAPECVLELADGEGKILRAVIKGASVEHVASMARTLWGLTP